MRGVLPVLLFALSCSSSSGNGPVDPDGPPRNARLMDVAFCSVASTSLRMDIDFPRADGARPVALFFHGGAWTSGTKAEADNRWLAILRPRLVEEGFVVASAEYRLSPEHRWPAHIEDAKCAVRFLRSRSQDYGLDPTRFIAWGSSAGGHLAALLGTTDPGVFEGSGQNGNVSSTVRAVVDLWGPADLTTGEGWPPVQSELLSMVFGTSDTTASTLVEASPVNHVDEGDVPFLIVHGERDELVPPSQSARLAEALENDGVSVELVVVANAGHGLDPVGGVPSPPEQEVADRVMQFFVSMAR